MSLFRSLLLLLIIVPAGSVNNVAQDLGMLEVSGRVKIGSKVEKIKRKRFFLFRGGLDANKPLVERIKTAKYTSRDCYYCNLKASAEYVAWLKAEDCESPYCRSISTDDIAKVPEFQSAYKKGLIQYKNKPDVARMWLTTNLTPELRNGFYRQQKTSLESILGGIKPLQSSMTDSVSVVSIFIDIPLQLNGKSNEMFLVSNVIPIEIGGKGYVWTCEVDISVNKKVKMPQFQVPEAGKTIKRCDVVVRDLPKCDAGGCTR